MNTEMGGRKGEAGKWCGGQNLITQGTQQMHISFSEVGGNHGEIWALRLVNPHPVYRRLQTHSGRQGRTCTRIVAQRFHLGSILGFGEQRWETGNRGKGGVKGGDRKGGEIEVELVGEKLHSNEPGALLKALRGRSLPARWAAPRKPRRPSRRRRPAGASAVQARGRFDIIDMLKTH